MIKSKFFKNTLLLASLCSASSLVSAETVVGQIVASPKATINAEAIPQEIGGQFVSYVEGDSITTGSSAQASINLTSGVARVTLSPNTVMSVVDADSAIFSLDQGAFSVKAKSGQNVVVSTTAGSFELSSDLAINAVASFKDGQFAVLSENGTLLISSQNGSVVTSIDSQTAYLSNNNVVSSYDVQSATGAGGGALTSGLIVAGVAVGVAAVSEVASDGNDAEPASPAQ